MVLLIFQWHWLLLWFRNHLPQLKNHYVYCINTQNSYKNNSTFYFQIRNQEGEKQRASYQKRWTRLAYLAVLLHWKVRKSTATLCIQLKKQASRTAAICWWQSGSSLPEHLPFPGSGSTSAFVTCIRKQPWIGKIEVFFLNVIYTDKHP